MLISPLPPLSPLTRSLGIRGAVYSTHARLCSGGGEEEEGCRAHAQWWWWEAGCQSDGRPRERVIERVSAGLVAGQR